MIDKDRSFGELLKLASLSVNNINNQPHQNTFNKSSFKKNLEDATYIINNIKRKYK